MIFQLTLQIIKTKTFLLFVSFVLVWQSSFTQSDKTIDSLMNVLKTANEDKNKVNTLNMLSSQQWQKLNYAEAKQSAEKALTLARALNFEKGILISYKNIGLNYYTQNNDSAACEYFQPALRIATAIGDKQEMAAVNNAIAFTYTHRNLSFEAIRYSLAALKIEEEIGDKNAVATSYNSIGIIYKNLGNYPEALKNYFASLKIKEEIGDKRFLANTYNNIGNVYTLLNNYTEALKNHLAALKLREELGNKVGIGVSYINIGDIYQQQGKYSEALKNYQYALKIFEDEEVKRSMTKMNRGRIMANCYNSIGSNYEEQSNSPEALKNYMTAIKIAEEIGDKNIIASCSIYIGKLYVKQNKYAEANEYLLTGLSISKTTGAKENIKAAYEGLAKLDSAMGNYKLAWMHYKLYTDYKDSLLNENNSKQIAQIKEQYESEKKDKEILLLTGDKQKLEGEKQISTLLLKSKNDSLIIAKTENDKVQLENDKVKLANEKVQALNLYNQQQIVLLGNEQKLHQFQIERDKAEFAVQKTEVDRKQEQLIVLNKEKDIQSLQLKKQRQAKNYLIAGIALLAILSFFLYRNYKTRQQLKLQTLRNKIASDLHDDIGSTLSSISIFSQMAQQQSKETIPLLETIGDSSRKMLDAMADIVWTINPENDQFEKIISRMKSFAYELLGAKKIDFEFIAGDEVEKINVPMEVRKNLYLIFKEATNNLVKYAQANKALFAIRGERNNLTMMIRDNGKGFDVSGSTEGNGLKNMKRRASEIGGQLIIDSHPGTGTVIELKVAV
jgi:signal transduction histidine kinase/tetratricopeptide (TPR) repeat protein